ncbi:NACHT, LRR and PYD domains-containing protein 12-like [Macrotis lagotis]|uniref:NACHT, LRR and PYD domains-containing protein 12-like n=1 Tax=Macrotis lagotis TaxID=92651 RepID=UPI003D689F9D
MEETVRVWLLRHLDYLTSEELEKFKFYLVPSLPRGRLEGTSLVQVADLVSSLGEQKAWELSLSIWEKMGLRELWEDVDYRTRSYPLYAYGHSHPVHDFQSFNVEAKSLAILYSLPLYCFLLTEMSSPLDLFHSIRNIQERKNNERNKYQERMREKFQFMNEKNSRPGEHELFHHRFTQLLLLQEYRYKEEKKHELLIQGWKHAKVIEERGQLIEVSALFDPDQKTGVPPRTVVLQGAAGIGKTTLAIKVILDWAEGKLYQDIFDYVFYLSCRELNPLGERKISFANLILKEWPGPQATMTEIMSQPERLLFIIDGLDELKFPCNEHRYDLCQNWEEQRPVSLLLSSLLRKALLPEASLLLTTRLTALGKFSPLLENPRHVEILGFAVEQRKEYFCKFFGDEDLGEKTFSLVEDNAPLFTMCSVPLMNWIVCTCLKQQIRRERDPMLALKTTTALYMCYISSITRDDKNFVPQHLRNLCQLAAEGIWERKLLFEEEDLRRHGLEAANVSAFLDMNIFQKDSDCENCYSFIHLSFQEFFAALFYVTGTDKEGMRSPDSSIPDFRKLLEECSGSDASFVVLVVLFMFGFLNAETAKEMERKFRCRMSPEIKLQLLQWVEGEIHRDYERSWYSEIRLPLWYSLFLYETQDAEFAFQVLHNVEEIKVEAFNHYEALTVLFCIKHCPRAWRISFSCDVDLPDGFWQNFFSVVSKIHNLNELSVDLIHSNYRLENICIELRKANCNLEKLRLENTKGTNSSVQSLFSISTLKNLYLGHIMFEADDMRLPWENLEQTNCQLQTLSASSAHCLQRPKLDLGHCHKEESGGRAVIIIVTVALLSVEESVELYSCTFNTTCSQNVSSALNAKESLKNLDLSTCCFEEEEEVDANLLGEILENPDCKIETLSLGYCKLNSQCSQFFSALSSNKSLKNLDLNGTHIERSEIKFLCKALENPNCKIKTLSLQACDYDLKCLQNLCSTLYINKNLKNLNLGETSFKEEEDINFLCNVLGNPDCNIQTLRLLRPGAGSSSEALAVQLRSFSSSAFGLWPRGNKTSSVAPGPGFLAPSFQRVT